MIGQETREVEIKMAKFCNSVTLRKVNEAVCEIQVKFNRIWLVPPSGLNAVAAAAETVLM